MQINNYGICLPYQLAIYFMLLKVFLLQVISLEGWTDVMYFVQDAHSFWNWIYFVMLIVVNTQLTQAHRGKHRTSTSLSW